MRRLQMLAGLWKHSESSKDVSGLIFLSFTPLGCALAVSYHVTNGCRVAASAPRLKEIWEARVLAFSVHLSEDCSQGITRAGLSSRGDLLWRLLAEFSSLRFGLGAMVPTWY